MVEATILKCRVEVIFCGITCLPNFMKIYRSVQKLLRGTRTQTERRVYMLVIL
jgi:hypothetical protein